MDEADAASTPGLIEALSPEVCGLTSPTFPAVAPGARGLRLSRGSTGTNHHTDFDGETKGVHTLTSRNDNCANTLRRDLLTPYTAAENRL